MNKKNCFFIFKKINICKDCGGPESHGSKHQKWSMLLEILIVVVSEPLAKQCFQFLHLLESLSSSPQLRSLIRKFFFAVVVFTNKPLVKDRNLGNYIACKTLADYFHADGAKVMATVGIVSLPDQLRKTMNV